MIAAHNPSEAFARVAVDELARCGVTDAVLSPGSRSAALAIAFAEDPRIRLHVQIDERSAGFLAVGLARASGMPAVVITTSGTAAANLHPAVLEADAGCVPLLVVTADRPPELRLTGANQTIDQIKLFGGAVRHFVETGVPEDRPGVVGYWRSVWSRVVAETTGLRMAAGPVHVNVSFREPTVPAVDDGRSRAPHAFEQPLDGRPGRRPWTTLDRPPRPAPFDELESLAGQMAATERGLIVVGDTTAPPGPVHALARATGWPIVAEPVSNARFGDHVVGHAALILGDTEFAENHVPDFVLRIGRPTVARPVLQVLRPDVPQLLLDADGQWADPGRSLMELVVADPALVCSGLVELLGTDTSSEWSEEWRAADEAAASAVADALDGHARPIEPQMARDVHAAVPRGGAMVIASSMPIRDVDAFATPRDGIRVVSNRGVSGIDGFVSTALGVALAHDGPVVALAGDLSMLHDRNGFLLSPEADGIDATFVVIDNDGGGIFHLLPQADYPGTFERVFGTPHGIDFEKIARTHGLGYTRLGAANEVDLAVRVAVDTGGIHLLHVRTDRQVNAELHRRIQAAVSAALR